MSIHLAENSYGKNRVRVVKVEHAGGRHSVRDLAIDIAFEGDFESVHLAGDNAPVLPTDTMKNTVYALAKRHDIGELEEFGAIVAQHFLAGMHPPRRVRVTLQELLWDRLTVSGWPQATSFRRAGGESRYAFVSATLDEILIEGGLDDLLVLKTSGSAFEGYLRDPLTTLKETSDRLLATVISARWRYGVADPGYASSRANIREALLAAFAEHDSKSVQHTLYAMAEAVLERVPEIARVRLSLPNKHHLLVDLTSFGMTNENEIFVPTDEPYGLIEATVVRRP